MAHSVFEVLVFSAETDAASAAVHSSAVSI